MNCALAGNLNASEGTDTILLLLKVKVTSDAEGKLKIPEVMFAIKFLSKAMPIYLAVVKLKVPKGTVVIRLSFNKILMVVALWILDGDLIDVILFEFSEIDTESTKGKQSKLVGIAPNWLFVREITIFPVAEV